MSTLKDKFRLPSRFEPPEAGGSMWLEFCELAIKYKAIDIGRGFPDFLPPQYVKDALKTVALSQDNDLYQYTRSTGHLHLVQALSKVYSHLVGRQINPLTQILTTLGGYHAAFCAITGLVDKGDEVIIFQPSFDCYIHNVKDAGGVPKFISFKLKENNGGTPTSADFFIDWEELEALFNDKTKVIVVNNPHNPLGKVFSCEELSRIAELCKKWNVVCIADEVYEFLVYDGKKHIRMASIPDMWERTLTICSAGKVFGVTGFKLGWIYGCEELLKNVGVVHQNNVRVCNTLLQEAVALCFDKELTRLGQDDCYFISLGKKLEAKRNFMHQLLQEAGMKPILPEGGYFVVADWSSLEKSVDLSQERGQHKDYKFAIWMTKNVGVQGIPLSPFYDEEHRHLGEPFIRFCFVKTDECLEQTAQVLKKWRLQSK